VRSTTFSHRCHQLIDLCGDSIYRKVGVGCTNLDGSNGVVNAFKLSNNIDLCIVVVD
jgi:hypothetical protein